jgi:1-acyl-sn-glycerol-3-phosphate acyltransferase
MRPLYRFGYVLCNLGYVGFFRGRVFGRAHVPLSGGVLLVCNHQSFLDPVLATLALPRECHYMARDSLFAIPRLRRLIETLNAFPVRRGTADVTAIKETLRRLKAGALITMFPEGTRTTDGSVQPMQSGAVLIARKAGVPIVPTAIMGAFEAWPRTARLPRPHPIVVAYDAPIPPDQLGEPDAAMDEIRRRIVRLMERYGGGVRSRSRR